jgi:hypothetical protein
MILILVIQVLQERNAILLIVAPLPASLALILVHKVVGAHAHGFPFVFFLMRKILPLLMVFSHVDAINTTTIALDPLLFLGTHSNEFFKCPLLIYGVVVDLRQ